MNRSNAAERPALRGQVDARPRQVTGQAPSGLQNLGLTNGRDAVLYVPPTYRPETPARFVLMLHGAGGNGRNSLGMLRPYADQHSLILLAPDSRASTWDVIREGYGPDVEYVNRALDIVFERYNVDPTHLAIEGFSDGASYALSLGITNGDLFTHIMAFSPGFMVPAAQRGRPRIFASHGTGDNVLNIDRTSRRIIPELQQAGYDVQYLEFTGPHTVPTDIVAEAIAWFEAPVA